MTTLHIIGAGGFAREVAAYYEGESLFYVDGSDYLNPIETLAPSDEAVIAIGDPHARERIANRLAPGQRFDTLILGSAICHSRMPGYGSIICPGTVITVNVNICRHVIVNLNCTIGHDCHIGDFTTISPGANISGNVHIGKRCYIGSNAVIREKINICDDVTIGAGAVVVKDITEPGIYVGNPAKKKETELWTVNKSA